MTACHAQALGTGSSLLCAGTVCGQGNTERPRVCGKASPIVQVPSTEIWLPATSAPLAVSLGGCSEQVRQGQWQSKNWANWERGGYLLCSLHWWCFWWPAAQNVFLNEKFVFMSCFSSIQKTSQEWDFELSPVWVFYFTTWLENWGGKLAIFLLLQFSFAEDLEQKQESFTSQYTADVPKYHRRTIYTDDSRK